MILFNARQLLSWCLPVFLLRYLHVHSRNYPRWVVGCCKVWDEKVTTKAAAGWVALLHKSAMISHRWAAGKSQRPDLTAYCCMMKTKLHVQSSKAGRGNTCNGTDVPHEWRAQDNEHEDNDGQHQRKGKLCANAAEYFVRDHSQIRRCCAGCRCTSGGGGLPGPASSADELAMHHIGFA